MEAPDRAQPRADLQGGAVPAGGRSPLMDTMEVNKACAAVLVAGIAFFLTGTIGDVLVHSTPPKEAAIKIEIAPTTATTGGPQEQKELPPLAPLLASAD